jgi:hypothetical protein
VLSVFVHPPAGFPSRGREKLEQVFEFLAHARVGLFDLAFRDSAEKAAARLSGAVRRAVDPAQEIVGDGDEDLGHIIRIYGISDG